MKFLILGAVLAAGAQTFASQVSCEATIKMAVAQKLLEANRSHEQIATPLKVTPPQSFENFAVYMVPANSASSLPTHSVWLVVVQKGPMATCEVKAVFLDNDIQ